MSALKDTSAIDRVLADAVESYLLSPEEAQHIKETAGFDQTSFEDLSEFFQGAE